MTTHLNEGSIKSTPLDGRAPRKPSISSGELMGNSRELIILHAEDQYRLRITSTGKLILTK